MVVIIRDASDESPVSFEELKAEADERALAIFRWAEYTIEIQR